MTPDECSNCAPLAIRIEELLQTIVKLTRETPYPEEVENAMRQVGVLTAEIGTLKARVRELEDAVSDSWRQLPARLQSPTRAPHSRGLRRGGEAVTREERERLRALVEAATPGPWRPAGHDETGNSLVRYPDGAGRLFRLAVVVYGRDADFIVAACEAIPALLDALDVAEARAHATASAVVQTVGKCSTVDYLQRLRELVAKEGRLAAAERVVKARPCQGCLLDNYPHDCNRQHALRILAAYDAAVKP